MQEPLEARLPAKTIKGFRKTACGMLAVYAASEDDAWAFNHPRGLFWAGKIVGRRGRGIRLQWYKLDPSAAFCDPDQPGGLARREGLLRLHRVKCLGRRCVRVL